MDKVYQTLLAASEEFKQVEANQKPVKKEQRVPFGKLRDQLIGAVKTGKVAIVKEMVENHPHIKETVYWQTSVARVAVVTEQLEMLKYLLETGARLTDKGRYDHVWSVAITNDNPELFKFLWDQKLINWADKIEYAPYLFSYVVRGPKLARILMDKVGVDFGFSHLITGPKGDVRKDKAGAHNYIAEHLYAGIMRLTVEHPEMFPYETTMSQLRQTLMGKHYGEIETKATKIIWEELIKADKPSELGSYIQQKITPSIKELEQLWYLAQREAKSNSLQWMARSETLLNKIKQTWPVEIDAKGNYLYADSRYEHSLQNLELLTKLGFDLKTVDRAGKPWIFETDLARNAITWLAKNQPEVFECKFEGKTMVEALNGANKTFAEKALLQRALISRHKPLRTKQVKSRL